MVNTSAQLTFRFDPEHGLMLTSSFGGGSQIADRLLTRMKNCFGGRQMSRVQGPSVNTSNASNTSVASTEFILQSLWKRNRSVVTLRFVVEVMDACGYILAESNKLYGAEAGARELQTRWCTSKCYVMEVDRQEDLPPAFFFQLSFEQKSSHDAHIDEMVVGDEFLDREELSRVPRQDYVAKVYFLYREAFYVHYLSYAVPASSTPDWFENL